MPFLLEPAFALWQFLGLAVLVVCASGASVYRIRKRLVAGSEDLPDAVFWDGFTGLAIIAPAVILPAVAAPPAGLLLGFLAAGAAAASYRWTPRLFSRQETRRVARDVDASNAAAAARHRSALARWQRYELDPAHNIDYPAMSDPRQPETAALIRAMRAAEQLRSPADAGYAPAVARLEQALHEAERAAGVRHCAPGLSSGFAAADPAPG